MQDDILNEKHAYDEIHGNLEETLSVVDQIEVELKEIVQFVYKHVNDRFGLEDWTQRFMLANEQTNIFNRKSVIQIVKFIKAMIEQTSACSICPVHAVS